ncbi:hypothetical protein MHO82_24450 [Vibrio sp. Of7-15]|uniref:hypothetical protein n=1 Tax=Vibrio sp. Of7-15 TaxID=2724879 RepID=UPI001EF220F9|nr:hypothetical protein [Vibrio sp. Of7-15]MCG7500018.1 hypothetical protein [Vibrio sp. Of7-15]
MKNYTVDARLIGLFEKLAALNPPIGEMIAALNIVLKESGEKIENEEDFLRFLEQVEGE